MNRRGFLRFLAAAPVVAPIAAASAVATPSHILARGITGSALLRPTPEAQVLGDIERSPRRVRDVIELAVKVDTSEVENKIHALKPFFEKLDRAERALGISTKEKTMKVRAKFYVQSVTHLPACWIVEAIPVWEGADEKGENIAKENHIFGKATPSGSLKMTLIDEAVARMFVPGRCQYVDFTPAGLSASAKAA